MSEATQLIGAGLGFTSVMQPPNPGWLSTAVRLFGADLSSLPQLEVGAGTALLPHNLGTGAYTTVKAGLGLISTTNAPARWVELYGFTIRKWQFHMV